LRARDVNSNGLSARDGHAAAHYQHYLTWASRGNALGVTRYSTSSDANVEIIRARGGRRGDGAIRVNVVGSRVVGLESAVDQGDVGGRM